MLKNLTLVPHHAAALSSTTISHRHRYIRRRAPGFQRSTCISKRKRMSSNSAVLAGQPVDDPHRDDARRDLPTWLRRRSILRPPTRLLSGKHRLPLHRFSPIQPQQQPPPRHHFNVSVPEFPPLPLRLQLSERQDLLLHSTRSRSTSQLRPDLPSGSGSLRRSANHLLRFRSHRRR